MSTHTIQEEDEMKKLMGVAFAAFMTVFFFMGTGCSDKTTTTPLSTPSDSEAAGKGAQDGDTLPQHIIDAVNLVMPNGTIVAAVEEEEKGKIVYEVEVEENGQKFEVEVDEDGQVLEIEEDDDDGDGEDGDDDEGEDEDDGEDGEDGDDDGEGEDEDEDEDEDDD
jgi:hypothetical protein